MARQEISVITCLLISSVLIVGGLVHGDESELLSVTNDATSDFESNDGSDALSTYFLRHSAAEPSSYIRPELRRLAASLDRWPNFINTRYLDNDGAGVLAAAAVRRRTKKYMSSFSDCISLYCSDRVGVQRGMCILQHCHRL